MPAAPAASPGSSASRIRAQSSAPAPVPSMLISPACVASPICSRVPAPASTTTPSPLMPPPSTTSPTAPGCGTCASTTVLSAPVSRSIWTAIRDAIPCRRKPNGAPGSRAIPPSPANSPAPRSSNRRAGSSPSAACSDWPAALPGRALHSCSTLPASSTRCTAAASPTASPASSAWQDAWHTRGTHPPSRTSCAMMPRSRAQLLPRLRRLSSPRRRDDALLRRRHDLRAPAPGAGRIHRRRVSLRRWRRARGDRDRDASTARRTACFTLTTERAQHRKLRSARRAGDPPLQPRWSLRPRGPHLYRYTAAPW